MDVGASWSAVARAPGLRGVRLIAPDLRGFGDATRAAPGTTYYFPDYIADVSALVDAMVPAGERVGVVGHSMGGVVSTLYSGTFPERVSRLAVLEGVGPPNSEFADSAGRMREFIEGARRVAARGPERPMPDLEDAVKRLSMSHPRVPVTILREYAPHLVREAEGGVVWRFDPLHRTRSPVPFYTEAFRAFAARVECPVLFIGGGPHGWHPADEQERLAGFRTLESVELPDAGHMMHWTQPDLVAEHLARLLR